MDDDELVFHTLMRITSVFNGLKTAVRAFSTRGTKLSFDEVVALLNSEDVQLLQDSSTDLDKSTVLMTTPLNQSVSHSGVPSIPSQGSSMNQVSYAYNQQMPSFNNYYPQVQQPAGGP